MNNLKFKVKKLKENIAPSPLFYNISSEGKIHKFGV